MTAEQATDEFCRTHGNSKKVSSKQHVQNVASSSKDHPLVAGREAERAPSGRNLGSGGSPSKDVETLANEIEQLKERLQREEAMCVCVQPGARRWWFPPQPSLP